MERSRESTEAPKELEDKPALLLAWRGLEIAISEGQMTRKDAMAMIRRWDEEDPLPSELHDQLEAGGDVAA